MENNIKNLLRRLCDGIAAWATPERVRVYPRLLFFLTVPVVVWSYIFTVPAGQGVGQDFFSFYAAGKFYLEGHPEKFYDIGALAAYSKEMFGSDGVGPFLNPPYAALLYAPFAAGGYPAGLAAWYLVNVALFGVALFLIWRFLFRGTTVAFKTVLWMSAAFFPTLLWLLYAQFTAIPFFILAVSLALLWRGSDFSAGLVLGLLAVKPQLALMLVLPLVFFWRWRALCGAAITALAWVAIGFSLFRDQMIEYIARREEILSLILHPGFPFWGEHSIFAFFHLLFRGTVLVVFEKWVTVAVEIALLVFLFKASRGISWKPGSPEWNMYMAACMVIGLLFGVHLFSYDLTLLLIPFFIVLAVFRKKYPGRRYLDGGALYAVTILVYVAAFYSAYFTKGQVALMEEMGFAPIGAQVSVPLIVAWAVLAARAGLRMEACDAASAASASEPVHDLDQTRRIR